jgi:RNA polymerase sigma-70 factor (ECF subfamily)
LGGAHDRKLMVVMAELKNKTEYVEPTLDLAGLFQQYYPRLYHYLRYRVASTQDVEDLVSTIFEQAYSHRHQFDPNKGAFSTWLFRIAHNELVNYYRKKESRSTWVADIEPPVDLVTSEPSPESQVITSETLVLMLRCLERLSERDQEVISLKFAGKLRNNEISKVMELPEKTVSVVLLRAVQRLRQEMGKEAAL